MSGDITTTGLVPVYTLSLVEKIRSRFVDTTVHGPVRILFQHARNVTWGIWFSECVNNNYYHLRVCRVVRDLLKRCYRNHILCSWYIYALALGILAYMGCVRYINTPGILVRPNSVPGKVYLLEVYLLPTGRLIFQPSCRHETTLCIGPP